MMEAIEITANLRNKVGKGSARLARKNGEVPAIIYGNKEKAISISINAKTWKQLIQRNRKKKSTKIGSSDLDDSDRFR